MRLWGWGAERSGRAWDKRDARLQGSGQRGQGWPRMVTPRALGVLLLRLLLPLASGEQLIPCPLLPSLETQGWGQGGGEEWGGLGRLLQGAHPDGLGTFSSLTLELEVVLIDMAWRWVSEPHCLPTGPGRTLPTHPLWAVAPC